MPWSWAKRHLLIGITRVDFQRTGTYHVLVRFGDECQHSRVRRVLDAATAENPRDSGPGTSQLDFGEDVVSKYLWARGISHLDAVAISHPHSDHIGGIVSILKNFKPPGTGACPRTAKRRPQQHSRYRRIAQCQRCARKPVASRTSRQRECDAGTDGFAQAPIPNHLSGIWEFVWVAADANVSVPRRCRYACVSHRPGGSNNVLSGGVFRHGFRCGSSVTSISAVSSSSVNDWRSAMARCAASASCSRTRMIMPPSPGKAS